MFCRLFFFILFLSPSQLLSQKVSVIDFAQFQTIMNKNQNDTLYLYNFWATWCVPCVKELPIFEALKNQKFNSPVQVYFVSLDFKKSYKKQLIPFLKNKNLQWPVYLLAEPNANSWIDKINKDWSGAIPATLMIHSNKNSFYEQAFEGEELNKTIETFLKP